MFKRITQIAIAVGLAFSITSAASAQSRDCKPDVTATGRAALTEAGARANAITNWRRDSIARFGEFYANFDNASDSSMRCAKTLMGLQRCEAKGRPCGVAQGSPGTSAGSGDIPGIACTSKDSKNCEPETKWLQSRLSAKGCKTKIDGSEGPSTSEAVKCFQRQAKLSVTGEVDQATVDALKK
jgi:hypothetical protein